MATYDNLNSHSNSPYGQGPSPMGSGEPNRFESTGFIAGNPPPKKGVSPWIKVGIPLLILIIIGAVVGGVVGSRHHNSSSSAASANAAASSAASAKNELGVFPTATNSEYMLPIYPSTTNTAVFTTPTFVGSSDSSLTWPEDPFKPSNPKPTSVRPDRPRLIMPAYKWQALPDLIAKDPYLREWNETIFNNATTFYGQQPVAYFMDGSSGILDCVRDIKRRMKSFAYAYRMTNDTKWSSRAWLELQNAAGNGTTTFGPNDSTRWNPKHYLDSGEMLATFAIGYDWLYDAWTSTQRSQLLSSMITYGFNNAVEAYGADPLGYGWWKNDIKGNWNCVCNGGISLAALAVLGDDTSGIASQLLGLTIPDAKQNCAFGPSSDGTWSETANYWYFGTTGHAEMTSGLITATGSDYGLLDVNPNLNRTGHYHMYVSGMTSLFNYGDHGPNKFSTNANSMMFYGAQFQNPTYQLFQRDQYDVAEPFAMGWYNPSVTGAFWDGLALDSSFQNSTDLWGSMRSSWTDNTGVYVAMKAGTNVGHQTHNDLDEGDFVMDALGQRWAGELGSGNYLAEGYFSSDAQDSQRWLYYRKRTEGQNCILVGEQNQLVTAAPTINFGTTGEAQGSSTVYTVPQSSTAYFTADLTSAYGNVTTYKRGIRMINGRKQILLQDEITASASVMWRMHTNATVTINSDGASATLQLGGQTMTMTILSPPTGLNLTTMEAVRLPSDPPTPASSPDQPNPGVTVVVINLPAGSSQLQVLFNPQWSGMSASDYKTPQFVTIDSWSTTSHP